MNTPCPECGFDLPEAGACPVCGPRPVTHPRRGTLAGALASCLGLGLLIGGFMLVDARDPPAEPAEPAGGAAGAATEAAAAPLAGSDLPSAQPAQPAQPALQPGASGAVILEESHQSFDISTLPSLSSLSTKASFISWMVAHTDETAKLLGQKWDFGQLMLRGTITHRRILEAFLRVPREYFSRDTRRAYDNAVLPIGYGQTISGPFMVGRMTDSLDPQPDQTVLEIGTGSGYQSAVLAVLCKHVFTVEIVRPLAENTDAIYRKHEAKYPELANISRKVDDGYDGWPEHAPFDRIIVTCGIDHIPPELVRELAPDGIMIIPVGPPSGQTILRITKHVAADGSVTLDRQDIYKGKRKEVFVPFTSRQGGVHAENGRAGASPAPQPAGAGGTAPGGTPQ